MSNYEISKSSLLSLKAEILRKQEDVVKAKLENVEKIKSIKKKTPLELKNKGVEDRRLNDLDDEEKDLLKLSKSKLEAKAKLYEKLSGGSNQSEEINRKYLVRFDKKDKVDDRPPSDSELVPDLPVDSDEETHFSDEYDEAVDPSEEWVEFTDYLGRSRKCLRKDLEYLKSKDAKLTSEKVVPEKSINNSQEVEVEEVNNEQKKTANQDTESQISTEESELLSGDMRREMLRQQWENEEAELRNKTDIHYQNVLFSEARQHGVGYYGFSKDEEERAKQQEALKILRKETEQQQKKAQDLKALRERQMAARMKAARNRRRARLGLPPEVDDVAPTPESKEESEEEKKKIEEQDKAEETEKLLIEARKRHVRPWDIGKEGVSEHYEMTQEEWNEKKRKERSEEFAPPKSYSTRDFTGMQSLERNFEEKDKSLKFSTKKIGKSKNIGNLEKNTENVIDYNNIMYPNKRSVEKESLKYPLLETKHDNYRKEEPTDIYVNTEDSSDRLSPSSATLRGLNPYKHHYYNPNEPTSDTEENDTLLRDFKLIKANVTIMEPTPIVNELKSIDFDDRLLADYNRVMQDIPLQEEKSFNKKTNNSRKRGVEIAPPATIEYYGPGEGKRVKTPSEQINISDSIEAGLRFLRKQADRKGRHCVDNDM